MEPKTVTITLYTNLEGGGQTSRALNAAGQTAELVSWQYLGKEFTTL